MIVGCLAILINENIRRAHCQQQFSGVMMPDRCRAGLQSGYLETAADGDVLASSLKLCCSHQPLCGDTQASCTTSALPFLHCANTPYVINTWYLHVFGAIAGSFAVIVAVVLPPNQSKK